MEQSFGEEEVKKEPVDLDYCQDDVIGSLEEQGFPAFVQESQPILVPELGNCEGRPTPENDNQFVMIPSKRKRGPAKKKSAAKRQRKTKNRTSVQGKSGNDKHEDNHDLIQSTSTSQSGPSRLHSTMLEEPQDIIIKTDQDNPAHLSVDLPCPPTLQHYTDDEISSAFEQCGAGTGKASLKLKIADPDSLFGKVYTHLTKNKKSCLYERQYLHRIFVQKYKPESLKNFSEDQIGTAFLLCYNNKSKLTVNAPNGLFAKVHTFLTENKKSTRIERKYLYDMWIIKYKEALYNPDKSRLTRIGKSSRVKIHRRLQLQRKRDLLLEQAMTTGLEKEHPYPSPELETTFHTEQDDEDDEFPRIPEEEKQIRIRVKVEIEADIDYDASNAENDEDSSIANDTRSNGALAVLSSRHIPIPVNPEPQEEANQDTDLKLTLKPVVRLTRLNSRKLQQKEVEWSTDNNKSQLETTLVDEKNRKSVVSEKYDDNSADDDAIDDYIAFENDHISGGSGNDNSNSDSDQSTSSPAPKKLKGQPDNSLIVRKSSRRSVKSKKYACNYGEDDSSENDGEINSDFELNTATPVKNRKTTSSSRGVSARAMKRARGRPRIHPKIVKKPRIRHSVFEKLVNYWHWGVWKHHKAPNQVPIPLDRWQKSHGKHAEFIVSNSCDVLKEDIEKTTPTAGKGTFANPHWTCPNEDKGNGKGPLKCVCPACGLTFFEIDELLHHRDNNHKTYISMCVICAKPIDKRINMAPHLATHCSKEQMEEFLEEEITTLGRPPKGSFYRLYKCRQCHSIFVGAKGLYRHKELCVLKNDNLVQQRPRGKSVSMKSFSPISIYTSTPSRASNSDCKVISECKVCKKRLNSEYMSLHLKTHFNFEEHKKYLREQQSKMKKTEKVIVEKSIPGKERTDKRIEQLKNLLESLERKNGKVITKWTTPTLEAPLIKNERGKNVRRDKNYGPVQCAICGQVIASVYKLRRHEITKHEGGFEKKFECSICLRPFEEQHRVFTHIPMHFNLEEQEKFSVWRGSTREFVERLNSGEDLNKPHTSTRWTKISMERRRIKKKRGRPRKRHHLHEDKNICQIGGDGGGSRDISQPVFSGGAAAIDFARNLEEGMAMKDESSTSTFSSATEVQSSTLHWNATYGQV